MATARAPARNHRAFVTLLTSDSYLPGALVALNSLLDVEGSHPARPFETVCLVTPASVGHSTIKALEKTFDRVVGVEEITTESWKELDLLGRRDLAASLTKLHLFRLTQYSKVIFLDADTLVLRPLSHLFDAPHAFSAAPDSGWPDAFNSGFMVATPSEETFEGLGDMMAERGSWDGGDQGLLNDYFPSWNRLSFTYNVTPSAYYTYAPAYRRHGDDVSVLHFIGRDKPWSRGSRAVQAPNAAQSDYYGLVGKWYDVYERHFGQGLTLDVASRIVNPPASFKSSYVDLSPRKLTATLPTATPASILAPATHPISILKRSDSPNLVTWDPSRSSPPRTGQLQMREAITSKCDNIWDDPSKSKQKVRFESSSSFPVVPASTHDWYKDVMHTAPNPAALKPVFPWEQAAVAKHIPSRQFPPDEPPPALPSMHYSSTTVPTAQFPTLFGAPVFTNAWDSIPGIGRYAKSLSRQRSRTAMLPTASDGDSMGGRTSSLVEMKPYQPRGDASSRDGDDEEEDETTSSETEDTNQFPIIFKANGPRGSKSSAGENGGNGSTSPTRTRKDSRNAPTSSRTSPPGGSSTSDPHSSHHHFTHKAPPRLNTSAPLPTLPTTSPRLLGQQAIRNSTAARLSASGTGTGNGPPVVRATRVFSAATDTGVVKKQGLAALQRFVENMESEGQSGGQGGGGSAGAFYF